jgi:hypothetical protein
MAALGFVSILLLLAAAPAAKSGVVTNERIPVQFEFSSSCNPANVLTVTGVAHNLVREDPVGSEANFQGTATDSAGNEYIFNIGGSSLGDPFGPLPQGPGAVVFHSVGRVLIVQKGETAEADDLHASQNLFHMVITPEGQMVIVVNTRFDCQ